ncbi:MAG TPA: 5-deoxy-glucuronate isomerase, partial [Bacteroidales bacterium]|nr:5-deoxy-glucuronate isomerase [Bacteroidales bacterium]
MKMELRYAAHPEDVKTWDTSRLRKEFLIENIFVPDEISLVYSLYDRLIIGGAMPVKKKLFLESAEELKSENFLERREMGIINAGGDAMIETEGKLYKLGFKEALYLGKGTKNVVFSSVNQLNPAKLYINSAPAHHEYSSQKVTKSEAEVVELGTMEASNHRTINKLLVNTVIKTCQLQMG